MCINNFVKNLFKIKIISPELKDFKECKHYVQRADFTLLRINEIRISPAFRKMPNQSSHNIYFSENLASFCQMMAYLILRMVYDQILPSGDAIEMATALLLVSFSIPPSLVDINTDDAFIRASSTRMCEVGYLLANFYQLKGNQWLIDNVKHKLTYESIDTIIKVC